MFNDHPGGLAARGCMLLPPAPAWLCDDAPHTHRLLPGGVFSEPTVPWPSPSHVSFHGNIYANIIPKLITICL